MSDIVLATLNARYPHSSFGLRYLMANMSSLSDRTRMLEFGINQLPLDILDEILIDPPKIVGFGVYIWNVEQTTRLVADLKRVRPDIIVVLGGPEVSFSNDQPSVVELADYVVGGEADLEFPQLCHALLEDRPPSNRFISAALPRFDQLRLPYDFYNETDIAQRVIYVEASRGCPFECEFCLSSLDIPVRQAVLDEFLQAMQQLLDRGVRRFKFVDRTFNLNLKASRAILEFFLDRIQPGLFLHFEMIPDRLPDSLRDLIIRFPQAALQFEVGIQTFNPEVSRRISRRQDNQKVEDNLKFLRDKTGVHVHADLIVGLPSESVASFAEGFDQLVRLRPQEIQVGMLKRLRGTPIIRHDAEWEMVYSPNAPYEILSNRQVDVAMMGKLRRFARYWDLVANSGNFVESTPLLWKNDSPFENFFAFSSWLHDREGRAHGIALIRLAEHVYRYLVDVKNLDENLVAEHIWRDYCRAGRHDRPRFLRKFDLPFIGTRSKTKTVAMPSRQERHSATQQ